MQQVFLTVVKGARRRDLRGVFRVQTGSLRLDAPRLRYFFSDPRSESPALFLSAAIEIRGPKTRCGN